MTITFPSEDSGVKGLKYLLGPISMDADLTWVPSPKRYNYTAPLISLREYSPLIDLN